MVIYGIEKILVYTILSFLCVVIALQLIYIHSQLHATNNLILKKGLNAESIASRIGHDQNMLRIYPLMLNLALCNKVYQHSSEMASGLQDIVSKDIRILPYICDESLQQVQVVFTKIGVMVLDPNSGTNLLTEDVKNERINYIIIREQLYGIMVHDALCEYIYRYFEQTNLEDVSQQLRSKQILILHPLMNHDVIETNKINKSCQFLLFPFIGRLVKKAGSEFLINLSIELAPSVLSSQVPMHVIGYKTS